MGLTEKLRKHGTCIVITSILLLLLLFCSISTGLLTVTTTLTGSATISYNQGSTLTYIIYQSGGVNYIKNLAGNTVYSNSNANLAFSAAFGYVATGGTLTVQTGTYTAEGSTIMMSSCSNVDVMFQPGSLLTITNNANVPVFQMSSDYNCMISGINVNGNGQNQNNPYWSATGIYLYDCSGCLVTNAYITNCATYGWCSQDDSNGISDLPNGITNSLFTFCAQNGICLGSCYGDVGISTTKGAYSINDTVAYSGDVGITNYGYNDKVLNCYIHDINGTAHLKSRYAIAVEGNGYDTIANNTIINAAVGIQIGSGPNPTQPYVGNLIIDNNITNCAPYGISDSTSGGNVIIGNNITTETPTFLGSNLYADIQIGEVNDYETPIGDIVSHNTLYDNLTSYFLQGVIWTQQTANDSICDNTITTNLVSNSYGIDVQDTNYTQFEGNNVQAGYGIYILSGSSCTDNKISQNTLTNCSNAYSDGGTGTIINPTSSLSYTLTVCNPYDGSAQGIYVYPVNMKIQLTSSLGLYVNDSKMTSPYTLTMNQDYFVYALNPLTL